MKPNKRKFNADELLDDLVGSTTERTLAEDLIR